MTNVRYGKDTSVIGSERTWRVSIVVSTHDIVPRVGTGTCTDRVLGHLTLPETLTGGRRYYCRVLNNRGRKEKSCTVNVYKIPLSTSG